MASNLNLTDIISEWGAFVDKGQNKASIKKALFALPMTAQNMTAFRTKDDYVDLAVGSMSEVIQRFQSAWTAKGDLTVRPNRLYLDDIKVDIEYNVALLRSNWLQFLENSNLKPVDYPFAAWLVQDYLSPKIQEDIEFSIFTGKTVSVTPGTPTSAAESINGIKYRIQQDLNGDAKMVRVTRTADVLADGSNAFEVIEEFADGITERYGSKPMNLYCSPKRLRQYKRSKRDTFTAAYKFEGVIDGYENITFVPCESMIGEDMMFVTAKDNIFYLTKDETNQSVFALESKQRMLSIFTQFKVGVGFAVNEGVFVSCNDSDLT